MPTVRVGSGSHPAAGLRPGVARKTGRSKGLVAVLQLCGTGLPVSLVATAVISANGGPSLTVGVPCKASHRTPSVNEGTTPSGRTWSYQRTEIVMFWSGWPPPLAVVASSAVLVLTVPNSAGFVKFTVVFGADRLYHLNGFWKS